MSKLNVHEKYFQTITERRIPYFDFLRGIAIIMICAIHTFGQCYNLESVSFFCSRSSPDNELCCSNFLCIIRIFFYRQRFLWLKLCLFLKKTNYPCLRTASFLFNSLFYSGFEKWKWTLESCLKSTFLWLQRLLFCSAHYPVLCASSAFPKNQDFP